VVFCVTLTYLTFILSVHALIFKVLTGVPYPGRKALMPTIHKNTPAFLKNSNDKETTSLRIHEASGSTSASSKSGTSAADALGYIFSEISSTRTVLPKPEYMTTSALLPGLQPPPGRSTGRSGALPQHSPSMKLDSQAVLASASTSKTSAEDVGRALKGLSLVPESFRKPILQSLDDPGMLKWLADHPRVFQKVAQGDEPSRMLLAQKLGFQNASFAGLGFALYVKSNPEVFKGIGEQLKEPISQACLRFAADNALPVGQIVSDVAEGRIPELWNPQGNVALTFSTGLPAVLRYLATLSDTEGLPLKTESEAFQTLGSLVSNEILWGNIQSLEFCSDGKVKMTSNGPIARFGVITIEKKRLTVQVDELDGSVALSADIGIDEVFSAWSLDVGGPMISGLLSFFTKFLLSPFLLILGAYWEFTPPEMSLGEFET
jgi:hypothetical protein